MSTATGMAASARGVTAAPRAPRRMAAARTRGAVRTAAAIGAATPTIAWSTAGAAAITWRSSRAAIAGRTAIATITGGRSRLHDRLPHVELRARRTAPLVVARTGSARMV